MLDTNVTKVGGSTYVLIPAYLAEQYKLENGDPVEITLENDFIIVKVKRKNAVR